jgi:membrane-bound lytic murein transglycosylase D
VAKSRRFIYWLKALERSFLNFEYMGNFLIKASDLYSSRDLPKILSFQSDHSFSMSTCLRHLLIRLTFICTTFWLSSCGGSSHIKPSTDSEQQSATDKSLLINANLPDQASKNQRSNVDEIQKNDLLERIRAGFQFSEAVVNDPRAEKLVERYQQRLLNNPVLIDRLITNATPYLHFVVNELEENRMPLEFALLPMVESSYDPFAYSPGRASGLWQFIPSTGRRFGLQQDWWQDERRDTVAATAAAIDYLTSLHNRFNDDWLLAIAAYNAGQGNVSRAIRKNKKRGKPADYWELKLPLETRNYIPKLLAWRHILLNADDYQISLPEIPNQPYFEVVDVGSQIDLAEAAKLAQVSIDEIYQLNPAFNRWATDPLPPHNLLVPRPHAEIFRENLQKVPLNQRLTWQRHIIKPNDSLIKIAKKFNTTPSLISRVNDLRSDKIQAGKPLLIPSASEADEFYSKSANRRLIERQQQAPGTDKSRIQHRVAAGESLWDISRQ